MKKEEWDKLSHIEKHKYKVRDLTIFLSVIGIIMVISIGHLIWRLSGLVPH